MFCFLISKFSLYVKDVLGNLKQIIKKNKDLEEISIFSRIFVCKFSLEKQKKFIESNCPQLWGWYWCSLRSDYMSKSGRSTSCWPSFPLYCRATCWPPSIWCHRLNGPGNSNQERKQALCCGWLWKLQKHEICSGTLSNKILVAKLKGKPFNTSIVVVYTPTVQITDAEIEKLH